MQSFLIQLPASQPLIINHLASMFSKSALMGLLAAPLLSLFVPSGPVLAQGFVEKPRRAPVGLATYRKGENYVKITYGRPSMKTDLSHPFGYSVPWRKLWRTGEDEATEITLTRPAVALGDTIPAGTYALFSIPDTAQWTLILNKEPGQWGTLQYNPAKDLTRKKVPVYRSPKVFMLFSIFIEPTPSGADIVLIWDRESVRLPLVFLK